MKERIPVISTHEVGRKKVHHAGRKASSFIITLKEINHFSFFFTINIKTHVHHAGRKDPSLIVHCVNLQKYVVTRVRIKALFDGKIIPFKTTKP
jgi:hypothetical protein